MLRRLRHRVTLLAGMLTCIAALALFFSRIWLIEIDFAGDRPASSAQLEESLAALDIRPGMAKSEIDPSLLQSELAASTPDFSFVGVRLQGVRLLIEATPAVPAPQLYNPQNGCDLVASCDAIVLSVSVRSGVACVKPGDTVVKGQPLILGTERVSQEENRSIAALGSVIARTWHEGSASAPLTREESFFTGQSSQSVELCLMNFAWPLAEGEKYPVQETREEILPIGGLFLPLEIRRTMHLEANTRTVECDAEQLRRALTPLAFSDAAMKLNRSHLEGCEIADRWIEYTADADVLRARAVYETHTNIAVTRDALYQQGG